MSEAERAGPESAENAVVMGDGGRESEGRAGSDEQCVMSVA